MHQRPVFQRRARRSASRTRAPGTTSRPSLLQRHEPAVASNQAIILFSWDLPCPREHELTPVSVAEVGGPLPHRNGSTRSEAVSRRTARPRADFVSRLSCQGPFESPLVRRRIVCGGRPSIRLRAGHPARITLSAAGRAPKRSPLRRCQAPKVRDCQCLVATFTDPRQGRHKWTTKWPNVTWDDGGSLHDSPATSVGRRKTFSMCTQHTVL